MKIIAIAAEHWGSKEWLIQSTEDEIAKITGVSYASSMRKEDRPSIGTEIKVSDSWNDLCAFRGAKDKLKTAAETLRGVAAISEAAGACYIIQPEPKKEEPSDVN